ncbi:HAD family phosphatase [Glycomyces sp. A-F 0318]|uniref:HAD family hydrolase n=1 Tax=Glycomyces amatae TaxID=2881355 RepID=UPI001E3F668D|nr:HAD family phosphatase [Glycomyces amatae]MCD0444168.1 HAD family phosphatase [Glycomyces amatae]
MGDAARILVVDFGSVLFDFDPVHRLGLLSERTGLAPEELHRRLFASGFETRCESGALTATEIHREVADLTGFDGDLEELEALWTSAFTLNREVLEALAASGAVLAVFSNNGPLFAECFDARFPEAARWFRHRYFACRLKARKPEDAAFEAVERGLKEAFGAAPGDLTLIDDNPDNTGAAARRGWRAHTFDGAAGLEAAVTAPD